MLLMADDYVGNKVVEYLCNIDENIEVFVYDVENRGNFNENMIDLIRANYPNAIIYNNQDLKKDDILKKIKSMNIEIGVLAWWPYIIDNKIIKLTTRGFINTHPGYLPYNRGKHPYFWSIVEETKFGATLHFVDDKIDHGSIIEQEEIPITWLDTGESLYNKSRDLILRLFYKSYIKIRDKNHSVSNNSMEIGTIHYGCELEPYCELKLDEKYTARELFNILRGRMFRGKGAAYFYDGNDKYYVSISIDKDK